MNKEEALAWLLKDAGDKPYLCPLCLLGLDTPEEKTKHIETAHGYETLDVS